MQVLQDGLTVLICADLTNSMQSLFWIIQQRARHTAPISPGIIKLAIGRYQTSQTIKALHHEIDRFTQDSNIFKITKKDLVLEKIIDLIDRYRLPPDAGLEPGTIAEVENDSWDFFDEF